MSALRRSVELVLDAIPDVLPKGRRFVIAIAGSPAAGKTTLAEGIRDRLTGEATVLGLDAYHFDDSILAERGHRERKGAPHTFDVAAYRHMLTRLRTEPAVELAVPRFDRALELSRNCAELVGPEHRIVITEGNYLLLDQANWADLSDLFDLTVQLVVAEGVVEKRSLARWEEFGLTTAEGRRRVEQNDRANARLVAERSRAADITIR